MPYINNNDKPSFLGGSKPAMPQKDVFGPRPQLNRSVLEPTTKAPITPADHGSKFAKGTFKPHELEKYLKSAEGIKRLTKELKLNPYGPDYYKELEEGRKSIVGR